MELVDRDNLDWLDRCEELAREHKDFRVFHGVGVLCSEFYDALRYRYGGEYDSDHGDIVYTFGVDPAPSAN